MELTEENRNFSDLFIDKKINNIKGSSYEERFIDILSDPSNLLIPRVKNAGNIEDNLVVMHNGIKVLKNGYYDTFSKILEINNGCHEPSEERMFQEVLKYIPENGLMIELGSYWCFYTIWFNKTIKNAKNYCIETELNNISIGRKNCEINNVNTEVINAFISKNDFKVSNFLKEKNINHIDILHSDIQGYEYEMLEDICELLDNKKIKYLFISTHSDDLHNKCKNLLEKHNYRIICSADYETETFCHDGIIVACHKTNLEIPFTSLGNRKHTKLRNNFFTLNQ